MSLRISLVVASIALGSVSGGAMAPEIGTAAGSMTVSGTVSQLKHVRAFPKKVFGRPAVLLVFSDIDLSAADAADDTKLSELGNTGKLHGMGIMVGDDGQGKKHAFSNEIYDQGFHGRMSLGGEDVLEAAKGGETAISGRLSLKPAKKFDSGVTFTYDVTFDTPIER